jgi:hypothetical protein
MRTYALTVTTALFIFGAVPFIIAGAGVNVAPGAGSEDLHTGRSVAPSAEECLRLSDACYDPIYEEDLRDCQHYLATCKPE